MVFCHPPKHQQTQEFDCWALHCFIRVTEEGDESGLFSLTNSMSENNSEEAQGAQQDPNNTVIMENSQENQENVPAEIVQLMTSETAIINSDDTDLIRNICPDMVDDDNQPLPKNVPTEGETTTTANQPQIFSSWEHSGSCFRYFEGGRKNKELEEGKDSPSQIIPKFNNEGKMVGLLLCVLEPIVAKGMVVILDSGFCVLRGIIELK